MSREHGFAEMAVDQALELLRQIDPRHYVITYDELLAEEPWRAWRLDRIGRVISASTPDELSAAIKADQEKDGSET